MHSAKSTPKYINIFAHNIIRVLYAFGYIYTSSIPSAVLIRVTVWIIITVWPYSYINAVSILYIFLKSLWEHTLTKILITPFTRVLCKHWYVYHMPSYVKDKSLCICFLCTLYSYISYSLLTVPSKLLLSDWFGQLE